MACPLVYGFEQFNMKSIEVKAFKRRWMLVHHEQAMSQTTTCKRSNSLFGWLLGRCVTETERKGRPRNRPYQQWLLKPK